MSNQERISQRAYQLWEQEGKPEGRENEHWEQARREIEAEDGSSLTESDLASGGLGPAADALREVAGSPLKDADMGLGAGNSDTEQHATNTFEKIGNSV
jgi:hypothetical protein